jgi:hypothetical protein
LFVVTEQEMAVRRKCLNTEGKILIYVDMGPYIWGDLNIVLMETKNSEEKI